MAREGACPPGRHERPPPSPQGRVAGPRGEAQAGTMLQTIADVFSSVGKAIATVVSAPFKLIARLFGGG